MFGLSMFRLSPQDTIYLTLSEAEDMVHLEFTSQAGVKRKYSVAFQSQVNILQAEFNRSSCSNKIYVSPIILNTCLSTFHGCRFLFPFLIPELYSLFQPFSLSCILLDAALEEVSLSVGEDALHLSSYIEMSHSLETMSHSKFSIRAGDFETLVHLILQSISPCVNAQLCSNRFSVSNNSLGKDVTFCLKEFQAILTVRHLFDFIYLFYCSAYLIALHGSLSSVL